MKYLEKGWKTVLQQPLLYVIPVVLGILAQLTRMPSIGGFINVLVRSGMGGSVALPFIYALFGLLATSATVSGYNAMVAGTVEGQPASINTFLANLTRYLQTIVVALVIIAIPYTLIGAMLPWSSWRWLGLLYAIGGAFAHIWLAAAVLDGSGPVQAAKSALAVLSAGPSTMGLLAGVALAVGVVLPPLFDAITGTAYSGLYYEIVTFISSLVLTAFAVVVRVAVFSAYLERPAVKE